LSRVVGGSRRSQCQPGTFVFICFICYGKYFTSELNKIDKKYDVDIPKQIHSSVSSIGGCKLLSRVVGGTCTPQLATKRRKEAHYRHM